MSIGNDINIDTCILEIPEGRLEDLATSRLEKTRGTPSPARTPSRKGSRSLCSHSSCTGNARRPHNTPWGTGLHRKIAAHLECASNDMLFAETAPYAVFMDEIEKALSTIVNG